LQEQTIGYLSQLYTPTLKESPVEAELASHKLLLRAAMIRKTAAGIYSFLPLGMRVLLKVQNIVREEMNKADAQEILMPAMQPAEIWHESGRWNDYGPELMRLTDRHGHEFCLGPTHEELVTTLVMNELRSYKDLPTAFYQIQIKFRDEIRPRFGLLRGREFIMKDCYSFHANQSSLDDYYEKMSVAYGRICERSGLDYRAVEADSGQIGGKVSTEFMALAQAGEAEIVYCESSACGYAANVEAAEVEIEVVEHKGGELGGELDGKQGGELEKVHTPNVATIADLAAFLKTSESATVKAIVGKTEDGTKLAIFIPGSHELNELKAVNVIGSFELFTDEDFELANLPKGYIGPVGLKEKFGNDIKIFADTALQNLKHWVVGANEKDYHFIGAALDKDFTIDKFASFSTAKEGDACPECGAKLKGARGIEVSQVFQLGTKYSDALGATFMDEEGKEKPFLMGCYGVGVTRTLAAIVEQHNDESGIRWPLSVAPAEVIVIPLTVDDDTIYPTALNIAKDLASQGIEVVVDDRNERPGVKFNDADLIGWPYQVVVGKKSLEEGKAELKKRASSDGAAESGAAEKELLELGKITAHLTNLIHEERKRF
jgi:prolyl-tRNA synthetase